MTDWTRESGERIVRGVKLVWQIERGTRGGKRKLWQAQCADRDFGFWYQSAKAAALCSNESDRVLSDRGLR